MADTKPAGGTHAPGLTNLIWRLRRLAEEQFKVEIPLQRLLDEPAELEALLWRAETAGDDAIRRIAASIREAKGETTETQLRRAVGAQKAAAAAAPSPTEAGKPGRGALLWIVVLACVVAAGALGWRFLKPPRVAAQQAAAPAVPAVKAAPVAAVADKVLFRLHGSNTIGEKLASALVEQYLVHQGIADPQIEALPVADERRVAFKRTGDSQPGAVEIFAHGSATAFKDLAAGATDIGMASRRIKPEEVAQLLPIDGDLSAVGAENVVGLDGVAIIVHPSNPLKSLSIEQAAQIFSGEITNWKQLGGESEQIVIHARDDKSGTYDTFDNLVLKAFQKKLDPAARRHESSTELSDAVASNPAAIGFIGLPYVLHAKALAVSASPGALPLLPTAFTVATEDYPLARRLYLYLPSKSPNPEAVRFVDFALSDAGQDVVRQIGFVSQTPQAEQLADDASLPPEYRKLVAGAARLSLNLRFEPGSGNLDTKAQRDIPRLLSYLSSHPGQTVTLLGFTDGTGAPDANRALSLARAKTVESILESNGVYAHQVAGFGSINPIAPDDTEAGRTKNRRVEVWVR